MSRLYVTLALACVFGVLRNADARPEGAPAAACPDLMPGHGAAPITTASPYTIYHNIPMVMERQTQYKITVRSTEGSYFRGFFCQVRQDGSEAVSRPYGYFTTSDRTQTVDCASRFPGSVGVNPAAAITHTTRLNTANISFYWAAPAADVPLPAVMSVVCTVVTNFSTIFLRLQSNTFYTNTSTAVLTTAPAATPTTTPSAPPATSDMNSNNCPPLATATNDAERYRAYLYCWNQRFEEWYRAYQNWLANGGQGCAAP